MAIAGINVNFDANAVILSAANMVMRPIRRRMRDNDMTKVLTMAKECTQRLQLGSWNVLLLEEEGPTLDILDVLATSCANNPPDEFAHKAATMAWELSDIFGVCEWACCSTFGKKYDTGWDGLSSCLKEGSMHLNLTRQLLVGKIRSCRPRIIRQLLLTIGNIRSTGRFEKQPPNVPHFRSSRAPWSPMEQSAYKLARQEVAQWMLDSLNPDFDYLLGMTVRPMSGSVKTAVNSIAEMVIDTLAILKMAELSHISIPDCDLLGDNPLDELVYCSMECGLQPKESDLVISLCRMASVVHFHYRAALCRHQYRRRLCQDIMAGSKNTGARTNLVRLSSYCNRNEERSKSPCVWEILKKDGIELCSSNVDHNFEIAYAAGIGIGLSSYKNDILALMLQTLGGDVHRIYDLQVSFVEDLLDLGNRDSATLHRSLSRRSVRLLVCNHGFDCQSEHECRHERRCKFDRALVLPYLNTIILKLENLEWAKAFDLEPKQPIAVQGLNPKISGGAVRRVANVLLVVDFKEPGKPTVNTEKLRILMEGAKKGEVFTEKMREKLIQNSQVRHRVSIDALKLYVQDIYPQDTVQAAALVREMAHDRLKMDSTIPKTRVEKEYDAYFDLLYWRFGHCTGNNVRWGSGVPLAGMQMRKMGRMCYHVLGAPHGCIPTIVLSRDGVDPTSSRISDGETPSAYLASTRFRADERYDASDNLPFTWKADISVGRYTEVRYKDDSILSPIVSAKQINRNASYRR